MSAFLASADCLNALATYWERKASQPRSHRTAEGELLRAVMWTAQAHGRPYDPIAHNGTTERLLKATKGNALRAVFGVLLDENIRSLNARYPDDNGETTDRDWISIMGTLREPDYVGRSIPAVDRWIQGRETGHLVGLLQGYEYQACESSDWEQSLAFMLCRQIRAYLLEDLSRRDAGDERGWADWTAPEDPRPVRMAHAIHRHR